MIVETATDEEEPEIEVRVEAGVTAEAVEALIAQRVDSLVLRALSKVNSPKLSQEEITTEGPVPGSLKVPIDTLPKGVLALAFYPPEKPNRCHYVGGGVRVKLFGKDLFVTALHVITMLGNHDNVYLRRGNLKAPFSPLKTVCESKPLDLAIYELPPGTWAGLGVKSIAPMMPKTGTACKALVNERGKFSTTYGKIGQMVDNTFFCKHYCATKEASSGMPILSSSGKFFGVHIGTYDGKYVNGFFPLAVLENNWRRRKLLRGEAGSEEEGEQTFLDPSSSSDESISEDYDGNRNTRYDRAVRAELDYHDGSRDAYTFLRKGKAFYIDSDDQYDNDPDAWASQQHPAFDDSEDLPDEYQKFRRQEAGSVEDFTRGLRRAPKPRQPVNSSSKPSKESPSQSSMVLTPPQTSTQGLPSSGITPKVSKSKKRNQKRRNKKNSQTNTPPSVTSEKEQNASQIQSGSQKESVPNISKSTTPTSSERGSESSGTQEGETQPRRLVSSSVVPSSAQDLKSNH
jgi:hypothetical protein